jgi:hypothetical protein
MCAAANHLEVGVDPTAAVFWARTTYRNGQCPPLCVTEPLTASGCCERDGNWYYRVCA